MSRCSPLHLRRCVWVHGTDYYCDANAVCGVRCAELDLVEANKHAFRATAHRSNDGEGHGSGLGGSKVNAPPLDLLFSS